MVGEKIFTAPSQGGEEYEEDGGWRMELCGIPVLYCYDPMD
jgi:hypothetical protein